MYVCYDLGKFKLFPSTFEDLIKTIKRVSISKFLLRQIKIDEKPPKESFENTTSDHQKHRSKDVHGSTAFSGLPRKIRL